MAPSNRPRHEPRLQSPTTHRRLARRWLLAACTSIAWLLATTPTTAGEKARETASGKTSATSSELDADRPSEAADSELEASDGGVPHEVIAVARAHFLRGVELYRSAAYDAALAEFSRAYESAPNYRILFNLGQIQAERHDYVAARELFQRYLDEGDRAIGGERRASVEAEIAELDSRISRLSVDSNVDGARLFINDAPAAFLPLDEPLLLNAGIHRLRVEKPNYEPVYRTVTLTGGDALSLTLDPTANIDVDALSPPNAAAPPTAPDPAADPDRTAFWLSLGATGALAGATLTFALLTRSADRELDEELAQYPADRHAVESARDRVELFAGLTDASAVATLIGTGITGYLFFATASDGEPRGLQASLGSTTRLWWVERF